MLRRLKIWNFFGKILFLNIFLLRKLVSKIFKATFFGKNLLNVHSSQLRLHSDLRGVDRIMVKQELQL